MSNEQFVPPGYHEQENGEADQPNYTNKQGEETWLYVCGTCRRAQTFDIRPTGGVSVNCKDKTEEGCGGDRINLVQSRLFVPLPNERFLDTRYPVIERDSEVD